MSLIGSAIDHAANQWRITRKSCDEPIDYDITLGPIGFCIDFLDYFPDKMSKLREISEREPVGLDLKMANPPIKK